MGVLLQPSDVRLPSPGGPGKSHLPGPQRLHPAGPGGHTDPSFTFESEDSSSAGGSSRKTISIYDRGSQFELLRQVPGTFMWTSPVPYHLLGDLGLVQKTCSYPGNLHRDILIYRSGYRMSKEEKELVNCLFRLTSQLS